MNEAKKDSSKIIGNAIKHGRMNKGWSQKKLAAFMNVVPSLVSKWESGKTVPPGDSLLKMAEELDLVPFLFSEYSSQSIPTNEKYSFLKEEIIEIKRRLSRIEEKILAK